MNIKCNFITGFRQTLENLENLKKQSTLKKNQGNSRKPREKNFSPAAWKLRLKLTGII